VPPDTARDLIVGADPVLASPFPLGEVAATALAAVARGAADLWAMRTGEAQRISVDVGAAAASLLSFAYQSIDGTTPRRTNEGNPFVALYEGKDGRWIHLHTTLRANGAAAAAGVLGIAENADAEAVAGAVQRWDIPALEDALAEASTPGAMVRTPEEWAATEQHDAVRTLGRVRVTKVGESESEPVGDGQRPLGGVRALDLTRVLAGPTCGRTLASHGADVLLLNAPNAGNVPAFVLDTSHGKRSAHLDLDTPEGRGRLGELVADCDVFTQGYRSGALERRGFGLDDVVAIRPGAIYVTINCYGDAGPWRERPGWEQLAQSTSGIAHVQGGDGPPRLVPAAACDYTTGYLAAAGVMNALALRASEGGSYHVQASLCQTATWLLDEGARCDPAAATGVPDVSRWMTESITADGVLRHLGPIVELSATPARWDRPSPPLGADQPVWI
jgi:crotonobetainyl-CoA:carnitine CoA-transferase CaiB-like acyl-CoA transferase